MGEFPVEAGFPVVTHTGSAVGDILKLGTRPGGATRRQCHLLRILGGAATERR
jgi:hypothetical protein